MFTRQALSQIVVGMEVYDRGGNYVGTVKAFRLGEGTIKTTETDIFTMVKTVSDALGGRKDLTTAMYVCLYEEGFISVDRGLFLRDAILLSNEIAEINEISIHLNVSYREVRKA